MVDLMKKNENEKKRDCDTHNLVIETIKNKKHPIPLIIRDDERIYLQTELHANFDLRKTCKVQFSFYKL